MEHEFDKEMDALLRKAAPPSGVLPGDAAKLHLDADELTAFAENALPEKSRRIYTQHLAECDPCRKTLSNFILLHAEAEPAMATAAVPVVAVSVPWYRKLFATRNLAYTMSALVLVFGGLLGIIVLQNSYLGEGTSVSQMPEEQSVVDAPARLESANKVGLAANANANTATNAAGEIPRSIGVAESEPAAITDSDRAAAPPPAPVPMIAATPAPSLMLDVTDKAAGQAAAPKDAPKTDRDEAKAKTEEKAQVRELSARNRQSADELSVTQQQNTQLNRQVMPDTSSPKKTAGPSRADVTRDNRSSDDFKEAEKRAPTALKDSASGSGARMRSVGGKKFELKQGAWYDTAYRGQRTTNVRRDNDEYRKLDSGLRNIADNIGGTVIVVWKDKAYRIQ